MRRTTAAREAAHASELAIGRLQQQIAFDKQQVETLGADGRRHGAGSRRRSTRAASRRGSSSRRGAMRRREPTAERDDAAGAMHAEEAAYADRAAQHQGPRGRRRGGAQRSVRGASTPRRRCATRWSTLPRRATRIAEQIAQARSREQRPAGRSGAGRTGARGRRRWAEPGAAARWTRCGSSGAHANRSWPALARTAKARLARIPHAGDTSSPASLARLTSLEELDAARAEYGDAARFVLSEPRERRRPHGIGGGLPRSRSRVRARGRSLPRRPAPARRRRLSRTRQGGAPFCARQQCGPRRLRCHRRADVSRERTGRAGPAWPYRTLQE